MESNRDDAHSLSHLAEFVRALPFALSGRAHESRLPRSAPASGTSASTRVHLQAALRVLSKPIMSQANTLHDLASPEGEGFQPSPIGILRVYVSGLEQGEAY
jgi:hypothetical protein